MKNELQDVSGPPGDKYTWEQLPEAIKALQDGNDIDYEGAAGPINIDDNGDSQAGVYDVIEFKNGKIDVLKQIAAGDAAASESQ
jgi:branched-chain amino acid transport system substrate-binding protein